MEHTEVLIYFLIFVAVAIIIWRYWKTGRRK